MTETVDKFDVYVTVRGGGATGQAGALRHGLSRALVEYNPDFRSPRCGWLRRAIADRVET